MPYTIGEVARMMNIAPSTLRYYEKEGLLSLGVRASNGQRTYTDDDIATLSIIEYLKFCGLPLKEIRSFLPLIRPGGETLSARRDILAKERDNVRAQIAALQTKLERLEFSCWFYETAQQYHIDVTWGDQYGRTNLRYFGMSEEQSYQCHPWGTADNKK